jgi:hypothetical protein
MLHVGSCTLLATRTMTEASEEQIAALRRRLRAGGRRERAAKPLRDNHDPPP